MHYRTKRAADRCAQEWTELGYTVTRATLQRAESLDEAFMHLIGVRQ